MKKIIWLTDTHLDHYCGLTDGTPKGFAYAVAAKNPEAVVITGDISSAQHIKSHFETMAIYWKNFPVYFVTGNHDYYNGSFAGVDSILKNFCKNNSNFHYLTYEKFHELTEHTAITGHNGWYDGGYSDWWVPGVVLMNDYFIIKEFSDGPLSKRGKPHPEEIYALMQKKAKQCENYIFDVVVKALEKYDRVVFATHVPPFEDAAIYAGKKSDWRWMPNFSSKICGDALIKVARQFPTKQIVVLCGHTHGRAECHPEPNITCYTGYSEYRRPLESLVEMEIE